MTIRVKKIINVNDIYIDEPIVKRCIARPNWYNCSMLATNNIRVRRFILALTFVAVALIGPGLWFYQVGNQSAAEYKQSYRQHWAAADERIDNIDRKYASQVQANERAVQLQRSGSLSQARALYENIATEYKQVIQAATGSQPTLKAIPLATVVSKDYRDAVELEKKLHERTRNIISLADAAAYYFANYDEAIAVANRLLNLAKVLDMEMNAFWTLSDLAATSGMEDGEVRQRIARLIGNVNTKMDDFRKVIADLPLAERYESEKTAMYRTVDNYETLMKDFKVAYEEGDAKKLNSVADRLSKKPADYDFLTQITSLMKNKDWLYPLTPLANEYNSFIADTKKL